MKLFKLIKLGYKLVKEYKKNEKLEKKGNIFGDDPENYGVEDLMEKDARERSGERITETKTYFPKEGGVFTRIKGEKYPFPGYPQKEVVLEIGKMKRMLPAMIEAYHPFFAQFRLDPDKYSKSVREVYRLMTILIEKEAGHLKLTKMWTMLRDMVCIVLEFDSAYRWRAQDMVAEVRLDELKMTEGDEHFAGNIGRYKWRFLNKKKDNQPNNKNHEKK